MVFREVSVIEVREALRAWLAGKSERAVAAQAGVDRKTSRRYVRAAVAAGLSREGGEEQLTDELIGQVVSVVRPVRPDGHGAGWAELEARQQQIAKWVGGGVPVVKIGILLARQGVVVAERTLHRFAAERCGAPGGKVTTPVDDGPPGGELQVDFGDLGLIPAGDGRRRKLRALVFTACFSRYMFVYLTFSMTLEEVIAGCEDAWEFFSGVFRVVVPDNMSPVVANADAVNPRLTREWLEYAQARGFVTDPALWGSITGSWPGRTSRLGSSLSDHFGRLPARTLSARLPDGADPAPGVQGCRAPGAPARERGTSPPDRPGPLRAGRPAVALGTVATGSPPPVG